MASILLFRYLCNIDGKKIYHHPCILRPPVQPEKNGLKLKVVLKWKDVFFYWKYKSLCRRWPVVKWKELLNGGVLKLQVIAVTDSLFIVSLGCFIAFPQTRYLTRSYKGITAVSTVSCIRITSLRATTRVTWYPAVSISPCACGTSSTGPSYTHSASTAGRSCSCWCRLMPVMWVCRVGNVRV